MSESNNRFVIHVVTEMVALVIVVLYCSRRMGQMEKKMAELENYIRNQQGVLNRHEALLSQLFGGRPITLGQEPQHCEIRQEPLPTSDQHIASTPPISPFIPMVNSLMGMLGTVASVSNKTELESNPDINVEEELQEELQELVEEDQQKVEEHTVNEEGRLE